MPLTTVEEKLDLILNRCKKNLSTTEDLKPEWIEICKKVAENNADLGCPLFRTYIRHLEEVDKFIYLHDVDDFKATATGLMFMGYVNQKNKIINDEKAKNTREK